MKHVFSLLIIVRKHSTKMIGEILLVLVLLGLIRLGKWVFLPYLDWKKNYQARNQEHIKVTTIDGKSYNAAEYREFVKDRKVELSLVVPSYNEEKRLPVMLKETVEYLKEKNINYEIIIINDGSKDRTSEVAMEECRKLGMNLSLVEYPKNRGKGGAVRAGMQIAVGDLQLMVDADGATEFKELKKLTDKINAYIKEKNSRLVLIAGSRQHLSESQQAQINRKWYRKIFSAVLNFILKNICGITINDTQCGFKLMTKQTAKILFEVMHVERWSFDIELFVIANKFGVACFEIPVNWEDVEGSKLNVFAASLQMFRDIVLIKTLYLLGQWKYSDRSIVL